MPKDWKMKILLLILILLLTNFYTNWLGLDIQSWFQTSNYYSSENLLYPVIRVIDGDTIVVKIADQEKTVRYLGIDTPESIHPQQPLECFGREATERNRQLVENQQVRLETDISNQDKYGRLLRYVYVGDTFVNLSLVAEGYASAVTYPPDVKYQTTLSSAMTQAREQQLGLWSSCQESSTTTNPCSIKGNINQATGEKIYHLPDCDYYQRTSINESLGERWFCSEEEARQAGWRRALNCP